MRLSSRYSYCNTRIAALCMIIVVGIIWLMSSDESGAEISQVWEKGHPLSVYRTAKGYITISELEEKIFEPAGFVLTPESENQVIPVLQPIEQPKCEKVFDAWQEAAEKGISTDSNPQHKLRAEYTLNGYTTMSECIMNEHFNNEPSYVEQLSIKTMWSKGHIDSEVRKAKTKKFSKYSYKDSLAVYYATKFHSIKGMNGAVIGSQTPWVEVLCLANGAESLITVDYQKLHITHPQIAFIHAMDVVKNREVYNDKFDFIVSFSSIEHSGLGRYGDPIDPFGDIKEMQKIRCMLKPGGLFFLGLPVGQDNVGWNCHRTYGRIRLAMMTAGFEIINVFYMNEKPIELKIEELEKEYYDPHVFIHYVFVLKKIY
ncbi:hypothetical protein DdX_11222 [Ditylenchus destructor]|uniref:DUF268 domain-containing protein n=1 Tax=Ditylenchus destructor TaxID=166010 RepID=A0AAD4N0Z2_9BILA|nr:hypothetical protein DdX_11222 [Ditylenchus destructor]